MLKPQLVLPTCAAGTTQLLQNLHVGFEQAGTRDPFLVLNTSSFPGLVAALPQRCHLEHICVLGAEVSPRVCGCHRGVNLAFQTLLAMIQDGLAWWELSLELPAELF